MGQISATPLSPECVLAALCTALWTPLTLGSFAHSTVDSTRDLNGYCCNPRFLCDSASQVLLITLEFTVNSVGYGSLHFLTQQG